MDNHISEDVPLPPEDAELPDMVPVSIRTNHPEFQHIPVEKVLAGVLLTWEEFLQLVNIRPNLNEYHIRGTNGTKHELRAKIIDYVNSFKKKLRIYTATLERINGISDKVQTIKSELSFGNDTELQSTLTEKGDLQMQYGAKKPQLIDTDKRRKTPRKAKESLLQIAQNVVQSQSSANHPPPISAFAAVPSKRAITRKLGGKRSFGKTTSPIPSLDVPGSSKQNSALINQTQLGRAANTLSIGKELKRLKSVDKPPVLDGVTTRVRRGRKPKPKPEPIEAPRQSTTSRSTKISESSDESSESEAEEPTRDKKKLLKQNVLKYLTEKVSPRSFMRLRNELMALRDGEKYFKVTSVVPMTAGMMEQSFCRKINQNQ